MIEMPALNTNIPDDLDRRFREQVGKKYGVFKGSVQKAVIEALDDWTKKQEAAA